MKPLTVIFWIAAAWMAALAFMAYAYTPRRNPAALDPNQVGANPPRAFSLEDIAR